MPNNIKVTPGHVSAVKFNLNKAKLKKAAKPAAAKATPAVVEKAVKARMSICTAGSQGSISST